MLFITKMRRVMQKYWKVLKGCIWGLILFGNAAHSEISADNAGWNRAINIMISRQNSGNDRIKHRNRGNYGQHRMQQSGPHDGSSYMHRKNDGDRRDHPSKRRIGKGNSYPSSNASYNRDPRGGHAAPYYGMSRRTSFDGNNGKISQGSYKITRKRDYSYPSQQYGINGRVQRGMQRGMRPELDGRMLQHDRQQQMLRNFGKPAGKYYNRQGSHYNTRHVRNLRQNNYRR